MKVAYKVFDEDVEDEVSSEIPLPPGLYTERNTSGEIPNTRVYTIIVYRGTGHRDDTRDDNIL